MFTYRRFKVLLAQLPQDSQFVQEIGGDIVRWDRKDHRLTDIVEVLMQINHNYVAMHQRRGRSIPKLKPLKRPGFDEAGSADERRFKGKAVPLAELKTLTDRWAKGGVDDGS